MESQSSSADEAEVEIGPRAPASARDNTSADTASSNQEVTDDSSRRPSQTAAQKRRRVTRACDECRRKKIKCDGKQPCTHCTVYSYDCTYDQPSHRRRNPTPQYIEALENRLGRAEAVIRLYLPNLDWHDPNLDQMLQQQGPLSSLSRSRFGGMPHEKGSDRLSSNDPTLESMVEATGQLDIDEKGKWDYHGGSSGLSFMRGVRDKLGDLEQPDQAEDRSQAQNQSIKSQIRVPSPPPYVGEQPHGVESPYDSTYIGVDELPSKELARQLCISALDDATAILKLVHQPSFYYRFDRIYALPPESLDNDDQAFLPLLYAVIALGCLFATDSTSNIELKGYKTAIGVGYKYFWACRQLMDVTDCRDITSLQAVIFMVMFLQCSAKLATCYSFIGVALRSALRMGLHRSFKDNFNPVEAEIRKRLFWVIRKMDIYVGAMLGLPQTLNDEDIDQEYPMEVDDDHITSDGIVPMPEGTIALMAAANANFRLAKILCKIVRSIYPIKNYPTGEASSSRAYSVGYAKIREIEMDLQRWQESLPSQLQPGENGVPQNVRQQQLLRMAYAHAQLMLYRPFLHYVSARNQSKPVSQRAHTCAAACISVSQNIIRITTEMKRRGLLEGSYWFTTYTTFFGILSLTFFALENPESPMCQEVIRDAKEGKETLARLARRSQAADRCTHTLNVLFEQISHIFESSTTVPRKREVPSTDTYSTQASRSRSELPRETPKAVSKSSISTAPPGGQRGSAAPRHRGMRLISQTGRPPNQKQQQHQPRLSPLQQNKGQVPRQQQSHPYQQQQQQPLQHQIHQPQGIPSANLYMTNIAADSPTTSSSSSTFNTPLSQNQIPYGHQQQFAFMPPQFQNQPYADSVSNLSNIMFPSENPFHYPNQPMTTLEQNYSMDKDDLYPSQQQHTPPDMYLHGSNTGIRPGTRSPDDHIDAQHFGPVPPYISQEPSSGERNMNVVGAATNMGLGSGHFQNIQTSGAEMWNQQARSHGLPGMNLNDIFTDEAWQGQEQ